MTIAVPVSWHIGSTPPAAMLAFLSSSSATYLSFDEASPSSRMLRSCWRWPGRSRWEMSWNAAAVSSVSASGSTVRTSLPLNLAVPTKSEESLRYGVVSWPWGNISWNWNSGMASPGAKPP